MLTDKKIAVYDARTGVQLRDATPEEAVAYEVGNAGRHPAFFQRVRIGDIALDEDTGPGMWFGGAGF